MIRLFNYFPNIRDAIILAICIIISFLLLVSGQRESGNPLRQIFLNITGSIGELVYKSGAYFRLQDKIHKIQKENAELSYENMQLQDALLENLRLRKLLSLKEKTTADLIPAEIIGENPYSVFNGLILNQGTTAKISANDPVLTSEGLVGKIVRIEKEYSVCQVLLDRNSRVSAKIQRNRELGVVAWDGGAMLKLLYIAKTIKILPGDVVMTSGFSQIFPENIKIGVVIDVSLEKEGLFQEITIQPSVNFSQLEEVFIVKQGKIGELN